MRGEFIDVGGVRAYYYAAGSRGAGHPILFLHGFAASGTVWQRVIPLVPAGHRAIVPDLAGHGRTEPTHGVPDVAEHARIVSSLLDGLNVGHAHLVAHGLGCEIAIDLAERDRGRVTSLLLLSPAGFGDTIPAAPRPAWLVDLLLRLGLTSVAVRLLARALLSGYVDRDSGTRYLNRHLRRYRERRSATALRAQIQALAAFRADPMKPDARTVVAYGEDDPFLSAAAVHARFAGSPGVTVKAIPDERHFLPEEAPERVSILLAELLAD